MENTRNKTIKTEYNMQLYLQPETAILLIILGYLFLLLLKKYRKLESILPLYRHIFLVYLNDMVNTSSKVVFFTFRFNAKA